MRVAGSPDEGRLEMSVHWCYTHEAAWDMHERDATCIDRLAHLYQLESELVRQRDDRISELEAALRGLYEAVKEHHRGYAVCPCPFCELLPAAREVLRGENP